MSKGGMKYRVDTFQRVCCERQLCFLGTVHHCRECLSSCRYAMTQMESPRAGNKRKTSPWRPTSPLQGAYPTFRVCWRAFSRSELMRRREWIKLTLCSIRKYLSVGLMLVNYKLSTMASSIVGELYGRLFSTVIALTSNIIVEEL